MAIAVVDIGSNSVRLVVYESLSRAPAVVFNEKASSGLGRGVVTTGLLPANGVESALAALSRYRVLCRIMRVDDVRGIATAAARDARNGGEFLARAEAALGAPIALLYGADEARLAALGVVAGMHRADGLVGDLGGGSLELTEIVSGGPVGGETLPLGVLSLADLSERNPHKAARLVRDALARVEALPRLAGRDFYAVGGTWRALARLCMRARDYPLEVMHNYVLPRFDGIAYLQMIERAEVERPDLVKSIAASRRASLIYGAAVLDEIVARGSPRRIVLSALGVREGLVYDSLTPERRVDDPLLIAAAALSLAHARDPAHGEELFAWISGFLATVPVEESDDERRLRHAACLLSDIAWRAHPDHRAESAFSTIVNSGLVGLDHVERVALALAASCRHVASLDEIAHPALSLLLPRERERARALGAAMRVAYILSAGQSGVLSRAPMRVEGGRVVVGLPGDLAPLRNERLMNRLRPLARLFGGDPEIRLAG